MGFRRQIASMKHRLLHPQNEPEQSTSQASHYFKPSNTLERPKNVRDDEVINKQMIIVEGAEPIEFVKRGTSREARYTCLSCNESSRVGKRNQGVNLDNYKIHCLKKHNLRINIRERTATQVNPTSFYCPKCGKKLTRKQNQKNHQEKCKGRQNEGKIKDA